MPSCGNPKNTLIFQRLNDADAPKNAFKLGFPFASVKFLDNQLLEIHVRNSVTKPIKKSGLKPLFYTPPTVSASLVLVPEMTHAAKYHSHAALIGCIDHFLVAHGAAGLNDAGSTCVHHHVEAVTEREESVAGNRRAAQ